MTYSPHPLDYQPPQPKKKLQWAAVMGICALVFLAFVVFGWGFLRVSVQSTSTPATLVAPTVSSGYAPAATQPATRNE